ncbi:MAG: DUF6622 family protein [Burkholderiaceae bacterium]
MILFILQHVPHQVWILLAVLIAIGISQSFTRRRTLRSATLIPVIMIALSFFSVISAFPQAAALAAWAIGVASAMFTSNAIGTWRNISWSVAEQRLIVPGSWVPMVLILGLFFIKFGVNVALAMEHELVTNTIFAMTAGFAYGAFSGTFLGRGVAMWKTARQSMQLGMAS